MPNGKWKMGKDGQLEGSKDKHTWVFLGRGAFGGGGGDKGGKGGQKRTAALAPAAKPIGKSYIHIASM